MKSKPQKTLSTKITFSGIGIHTGQWSTVTLCPAPVDHGIRFIGPKGFKPKIAHISNVVSDAIGFSTSLGIPEWVVWPPLSTISTYTAEPRTMPPIIEFMTIEHLMAAFYFAEITNCLVVVDGQEIPILDGSAWDILKLIYDQPHDGALYVPKIVTQMKNTNPIVIDKEYSATGPSGEWVSLIPNDEFEATITIDFRERSPKLIGEQHYNFSPEHVNTTAYAQSQIACARTFGFYSDMQKMHSIGKALGAGLENCIVIDEATDTTMNKFDLYWKNEFVRHKLVDVLGDLMLAGRPIIGRFVGFKPSHKLVHELLRKIPDVTAGF